MLYNLLKVLHVISATFFLMSLVYCYHLWKKTHTAKHAQATKHIQTQSKLVIIPLALTQLFSGFYMLSLHHEDMTQQWIHISIIGFFTLIVSWFTFIYFLLLSSQTKQAIHVSDGYNTSTAKSLKFYQHIQQLMFIIITITLFTMIYFMTNKITSP